MAAKWMMILEKVRKKEALWDSCYTNLSLVILSAENPAEKAILQSEQMSAFTKLVKEEVEKEGQNVCTFPIDETSSKEQLLFDCFSRVCFYYPTRTREWKPYLDMLSDLCG